MRHRNEVLKYRNIIRKKQRKERIKGTALIVFSLVLMFYSVPCFATSVWDSDSNHSSGIVFSSDISDHELVEDQAATTTESEAPATSTEPRVYDVAGFMVGETTGPGLLDNEEAIKSAKLRAQAVSVATAERNARILANENVGATTQKAQSDDLPLAIIALALSVLCATLGIRTIVGAQSMRGKAAAAAFDSALRAY